MKKGGGNSSSLPWSLVGKCRSNKLCLYVVLAEFDINTGSTVRHQYPAPVPGCSDDWLAEQMLPEGVHNRDIDTTYIILNRANDETLLYGMNLCKTKHDSSVLRGARVRSIAIFSQFSYVEIFKKALDYTLELYIDNPSLNTLIVSSYYHIYIYMHRQPVILTYTLISAQMFIYRTYTTP